MKLTVTDVKIVDLLKKHGGTLTTVPSKIGLCLFPDGANHRYPQGMVLCGMRAMRRAESKQLIKIYPAELGFTFKLVKP